MPATIERQYQLTDNRRAFILPAEVRALKVDVEQRTAELSFSSDMEGDRGWYVEQLLHGSENVDLNRLNNGGALLLNHDRRQQVGVVERAWLDGNKARALVRFSRSQAGQDALNDVEDGIRRNVSVGYSIHKYEEEQRSGQLPILRATLWEPLEISLVPIPFDTSVGTDRGLSGTDVDAETNGRTENTPMPATATQSTTQEPKPEPQRGVEIDLIAERERLAAMESLAARNASISAICARLVHVPGIRELADKFLQDDKRTEREFCHEVLSLQEQHQRAADPGNVNLSPKEQKEYSILRALQQLQRRRNGGRAENCFELEVDEEIRRKSVGIEDSRLSDKYAETRLFIPNTVRMSSSANKRALVTSNFASAGALIGDELQTGSFIELLRNNLALSGAGVRILTGLSGNVVIPRQTGAASAAWLGETTTATPSDPTFGHVTLSPKRLAALTNVSTMMIAQASEDMEALVRDDLLQVIALKLDQTALHGSGGGPEPLGVQNQTGISGVTFGGAAVWADICEFIGDVAASNVPTDSGSFVTSIAVRTKWASILKDNVAGAGYLWELGSEQVAGYRAVATNQVLNNIVFFGRWSDLIIGTWSAPSLMLDPYTLMADSTVRIYAEMLGDMNIRYAGSFCVSTDSGAQS
jgi:HK97 family phage major capsid protein